MGTRPLADVPRPVWALFAVALAAQLAWRAPAGTPDDAPMRPVSVPLLRLASLGEPVALAKALMLYVQGAEGQRSFQQLDYNVLAGWLDAAVDLDARGQYPLMLASEVYAATSDRARSRRMLDFVHARFADDPDRRWPWLAHAALAAKHRLHDLPLARRYAHDIRTRTTPGHIPPWAQQLEVFVLDEMNETESERVLIGAMIASGQVTDPRELAFLAKRLAQLPHPGVRPKARRAG